LASKDGHILGERRQKGDPQTVKFYISNPDLVYADTWPFPRYATHSFVLSLGACFKAYYEIDIEYTYFGKPELSTSNYAEKLLKAKAQI
jgi:HAD superfamily hydrolase (TIGR01450 family)